MMNNLKYFGLTGSQIIKKKFIEYGIDNVSIYSGGAIMSLIDELHYSKNKKIDYNVHTHEQFCGHCATGYAKTSGKLGVSIVTSGPGLTNSITPMLDSTNDSTPLMVISGQVSLDKIGTLAFQECDAVNYSKYASKFSHCLQSVEEIPYIFDKAYHLATSGKKGSVHLDLPKCIANDVFQNTSNKYFAPTIYDNMKKQFQNNYYDCSSKKYLKNISEKINNSKKPIFVIGQGCKGLSNELTKLINKTGIPITTTLLGVGLIDQTNEHSLKWLGMHGYAPANFAVYESDCIINIGGRFDDRTTGNTNDYGKNAKGRIIHVNIEPDEIGKNINSDLNIVDTAENFINSVTPLLNNKEKKNRDNWWNKINKWKDKYPFEYQESNYIKTPDIVKTINSNLDKEKKYIFTTGVGNHQMQTGQYIEWNENIKLITSGSLGVMGVGIPYGIGAKLAEPNSEVIVIDGDSSSLMSITDLKTIKENNINIKILICDNSSQGMVEIWEKLFFENRITATKNECNPDFVKLADAFGIKTFECTDKEKLDKTIKEFLNYNNSALLRVKCINDICLPLIRPGSSLNDMLLMDNYKEHIKLDINDCPS